MSNWRESSNRSVAFWHLGGTDEGTVATHAEARDGSTLSVDVEVALNKVGQLFCHVSKHVEVLIPRRLSCVTVLTSSVAHGPVFTSVGDVSIDSSGTCIWEDHGNLALLALSSILSLHCGVFPRASQSR